MKLRLRKQHFVSIQFEGQAFKADSIRQNRFKALFYRRDLTP